MLALQARLLSRPLGFVENALIERRSLFTAIIFRLAALLLLLLDSAFGILRDLFWVLTAPLGSLLTGLLRTFQLTCAGKPRQAFVTACHCFLMFLFATFGWVLDSLLRLVRTFVDSLDTALFGRAQRSLTVEERLMLQTLFGTSLYYSLVRVSYGCPSLRLMTPHVAGNVMYLPERNTLLDSTGKLSEGGRSLLFHEATHIWQHHNGGGSYMHRALVAQLMGSLFKGGRGYAYDWRRAMHQGIVFEALNPEQQAQLAQEIGVRLTGKASRSISFDSQMEQDYVDRALACLQSGSCRI